ncbi:uncharacterized protein V6R79_023439 [Siganus canaliculatus]
MSSTGEAVAEPPERRGAEAGAGRTPAGHRGGRGGREERRAVGAQEWSDGSKYEGGFVDGLKHGKGKYTWKNGESYKGHFYKDYKHGDGLYCWPTGHKFIGKFYLNRKEGYGRQLFPDGATFRGLYYADQRFGPGLASYPDGSQDVGLWLGNCLLRLCAPVEDNFSLRRFPEYAAYMDPNVSTDTWTQPSTSALHSETRPDSKSPEDQDLLPDDDLILPPGIETLCTNGDDLPLPPRRRQELDRLFFGKLWEADTQPYQGYQRYPLSSLPVLARMHAHVHKHRLQATDVDWDVAAVLSLNRQSFGPKGPLEVRSEMLIQHASRGDLHAVSQDLQTGLVHVDVADSHGHTALIAATGNCRNSVIHLLLDMGADIDKLNSEGMSALAVCHVLYYPFLSLHAALIEPLNRTQDSPSTRDTDCQMPEEADTDQSSCTNLSDLTAEETHVSDHGSSVSDHSAVAAEHLPQSENLQEEQSQQREGTCNETERRDETTAEEDDWTHHVSDGEVEEKGEELTRTEEEEVAELDEEKATDSGKELTEGRDEESSDDDVMEREERGKEDAPFVMRSLHVLDGHIPIGSVQWKEYPPKPAGRVRQGRRKHLTSEPSLDSACPVNDYDIHVTEELMQQAAEALSRTGIPQRSDTEETVRKMAAMKVEHRARLKTLNLLIERGADPNLSRVPMPVLFLAVMAADTEVIRSLLLHGARTDIPLPPQRNGFYPLHIAAALPGPAGPRITELLLDAAAVPDAQAADKNEIYEPDQISWDSQESESSSESVEGGGRTALHVACQRDGDFQNVSKVVALLLSHGACADLLWSGHSPLSLAIANGNDLAVEELLKGGADPNIPLGSRVGSALCALCNISYHFGGNRLKLFDSLVKAGADILMPVSVGDVTGTALDYAHYSFKQVSHRGRIPFLALNTRQKETFRVQRELLSRMAALLRQETSERERLTLSSSDGGVQSSAAKHRFKFCFHCGRSVSVKLTACGRCHKVFFCSKACAMKASEEGHKEDCVMVPASTDLRKSPVFKPEWDPRPFTSTTKPQPVAATLKPPMVPMPSTFKLKSQSVPEASSVAQEALEVKAIKVNPEENYSFI